MSRTTARRAAAITMPIASIVAGAIVLQVMFGASDAVTQLRHVNLGLVAAAFLIGVLIEAVRAARTALLLSEYRPIGFEETFGIQVVSYGFGHLVPLAPTTTGLRCLLTHRVNGTPWLAAAGVFLGADVLDRAALLPLLLYPLATQALPTWQRVLLSGLVVQSLALCALLLAGGRITRFVVRWLTRFRRSTILERVVAATNSVMTGVSAVSTCRTKKAVAVACLTVLSSAIGILRLKLLLMAVGLTVSPSRICLLLIFSSLVGFVPLPLPGAGTLATAKSLAGAGVVGIGTSSFTLVTRGVSAIETPLLAVCILLWWSLRRSPFSIGWKDLHEIKEGLANARPSILNSVDQAQPSADRRLMLRNHGTDELAEDEHAA